VTAVTTALVLGAAMATAPLHGSAGDGGWPAADGRRATAGDRPVAAYELRSDGTEVQTLPAGATALSTAALSTVPLSTAGLSTAALSTAASRRSALAALSVPGKSVYYVESHLPRKTAWPYRKAVKRVDRLTGSRVRYGKCPQVTWASPHGCIRLYEARLAPNVMGLATWWGDGRVVIELSPRFRGQPWRLRYAALVHELGHGFGLPHNASCKSVMYWHARCIVGKGFTAAERRHLRTQ
jgi:hypothetical protein